MKTRIELLTLAGEAAQKRHEHWMNSINGGLAPSRRAKQRKLSERYHREAVRLSNEADRAK